MTFRSDEDVRKESFNGWDHPRDSIDVIEFQTVLGALQEPEDVEQSQGETACWVRISFRPEEHVADSKSTGRSTILRKV